MWAVLSSTLWLSKFRPFLLRLGPVFGPAAIEDDSEAVACTCNQLLQGRSRMFEARGADTSGSLLSVGAERQQRGS